MAEGSFSHESKITVALVIVLLGGAMMLGIQIQKINSLDDRVARIESKLDQALTFKALTANK